MPSIFHITADTNCTLFRYGEKVLALSTGVESVISFPPGRQKLKFVSEKYNDVIQELVLNIPSDDYEDFIEVKLREPEIEFKKGVFDDDGNWYSPDWKTLRRASKNLSRVIVHKHCVEINTQAFFDCKLQSVDLPQGLKNIGPYAFEHCHFLEQISIPESVEEISISAFSYCVNLKTVVLPNGITFIPDSCFWHTGVESIIIPSSVKEIKSAAFAGSQLKRISFAEGLQVIEDRAFKQCEKLEEIVFPSTLKSLGESSFADCYSLSKVNCQGYYVMSKPSIPYGIKNIPQYCFANTNITTITLPSTVENISQCAFAGCSSLKSAELYEGLKNIGVQAFYGCKSLSSIRLPKGVKTIEREAFSYCKSLDNVNNPSSVTQIGKDALLFVKPFIEKYYEDYDDNIYKDYEFNPEFHITYYVDKGCSSHFRQLIGEGIFKTCGAKIIEV